MIICMFQSDASERILKYICTWGTKLGCVAHLPISWWALYFVMKYPLQSFFLASCKVTDANYSYLVVLDTLSIIDQIAFAKS